MLSLQTVLPNTLELLKFESVPWEEMKNTIKKAVEIYNTNHL